MGLLSCPTVINQRPSRLKNSLTTASLCAGRLCNFCPDVASQISTVPLAPHVGSAIHFPSGLTAIAREEAHTTSGFSSVANCHDHTLRIFAAQILPRQKRTRMPGIRFLAQSFLLPSTFACSRFSASFPETV